MLPPYVELPNRLVGQGPYLHSDAIFHGFVFEGERRKLQSLLDDMFERPSGGRIKYTALTKKVMVSFANIARISSVSEPYSGWVSEIDVAIWILAVAHQGGLHRLRWIPAFLFVDGAAAMVAGREVYGFPKQLGWFEIASTGGAMTRFTAETTVFERFDPAQGAIRMPVIEIEPLPGDGEGAGGRLWGTLAAASADILDDIVPAADRLRLPGLDRSVFDLVPPMTMAFLKQFPDVSDTRLACHQSITECQASVQSFRAGGRSTGKFRGRVNSYPSHPFYEKLGIAPGWHEIGRATWLDYDFLAHMGVQVWP